MYCWTCCPTFRTTVTLRRLNFPYSTKFPHKHKCLCFLFGSAVWRSTAGRILKPNPTMFCFGGVVGVRNCMGVTFFRFSYGNCMGFSIYSLFHVAVLFRRALDSGGQKRGFLIPSSTAWQGFTEDVSQISGYFISSNRRGYLDFDAATVHEIRRCRTCVHTRIPVFFLTKRIHSPQSGVGEGQQLVDKLIPVLSSRQSLPHSTETRERRWWRRWGLDRCRWCPKRGRPQLQVSVASGLYSWSMKLLAFACRQF